MAKKKRVKAGTSKRAAADRKVAFAHAYIVNGKNGTQAAVTAGYKPGRAAQKAAQRLSQDVVVQELIAKATKEAAEKSGLSVDRTLQEVARLAYADPRKLYDDKGNLKPVHELDADAAATVASVEVDELFEGRGEDREMVGLTKKIKQWDKRAALDMAMKYHGLYEQDNKQKPPAVIVVSDRDAKL